MLQKNITRDWVQKLLYSWLIFCVGGVGSLTYFDGFLPGHEHGEHPFHLTIFERSTHHHHLPPQPQAVAAQMRFFLTPTAYGLGVAQNLAPGFSRFFASGLSDGYLLTVIRRKFFDPLLHFDSVRHPTFTGQSAWIAPPEKPPSAH